MKRICKLIFILLVMTIVYVPVYAENNPYPSEAYIVLQNTSPDEEGSYTRQYVWLSDAEPAEEITGVSYDSDTNTLTLDDAEYPSYILETFAMGDDLKICVKGTCGLAGITTGSGNRGGSLAISGTGTLKLNENKIGNDFGNSTVLVCAAGDNGKLSIGSSVKLVAYRGNHDHLITIVSDKAEAPVSILGTPTAYEFLKSSDSIFVCENDSITVTPRYTVKFNVNGGKDLSMAAKKVTEGTELGKLPTAGKEGYVLEGWYTAKTNGEKVTGKTVIDKALTCYARWKKVTVYRAAMPDINIAGKGKLSVKIGKVTGAAGYEILYGTDSKFKNAKKVFTTEGSKKIENIKSSKACYVKVRAYRKDSLGNKVYGRYSKVAKLFDDGGVSYGLPYLKNMRTKDDGNRLVLVNKQYGLSSKYRPKDMVRVDGSLSTNQNLYFKRKAYKAYLKMLKNAKKDGISFLICSAYRSYGTQRSIYTSHIARTGVKQTNTVSAYPGRSEHQTGWAVDITSRSMGYTLSQNFANYPEGKWIGKHCSEYGFILRYPKGKSSITGYSYEPWHLRYVGVDVAKEITSRGITFEEYLGKAPERPAVKSAAKPAVKSRGKGSITVNIEKVTGANGYQIAYSTNYKFKNGKGVLTTSRTKRISKLKSKRTYYVKVRAYKKDIYGYRVYGKYSKAVKVKVK